MPPLEGYGSFDLCSDFWKQGCRPHSDFGHEDRPLPLLAKIGAMAAAAPAPLALQRPTEACVEWHPSHTGGALYGRDDSAELCGRQAQLHASAMPAAPPRDS